MRREVVVGVGLYPGKFFIKGFIEINAVAER